MARITPVLLLAEIGATASERLRPLDFSAAFHRVSILCCVVSGIAIHGPAAAQDDDTESQEAIEIVPIVDARLRYETASQDNELRTADALTLRVRGGAQVTYQGFSFLAEAEGTVAIVDDFNDTIPSNGIEPFSVVADPENLELNRLQIAYASGQTNVTVGRQRIIHPGARFVGNVAWRQNEQTFDAVRGRTRIGPVSLDASYAISQRTIFGVDSPNEAFDGDLVLLRADADLKPVKLTGYSYIVDYDDRIAFSSQTYGGEAVVALPLGPVSISGKAAFATQSDIGANPISYSADYYNFELGGSIAGFGLKAGYEELGSDGGIAAFQTPLATLHLFNGFADIFLVTPDNGLRDSYVTLSKSFNVKALPGLRASMTFHEFDSDFGGQDYGTEFDAVLSFRVRDFTILAKYANYDSDGFAVDSERFWLQVSFSL